MAKSKHVYGFVGLGQMGGPMAANLAKAGVKLICYDQAGTEDRLPASASAASSVADLCAHAQTVFLSLPDGAVSQSVCEEIVAASDSQVELVIDLSTVGPQMARQVQSVLAAGDIEYADAPVSGGRGGATAGTIAIMWGGSKSAFDQHSKTLSTFTGNAFHVGDEPGQGQALKLLNNFLSATAMAATAEAMHFGLSQGLDMKTMLDVVNVSSGQNTATKDKFLKRVLPGTYDGGFAAALMNKDVQLFLSHVAEAGTPNPVGKTVGALWQEFNQSAEPGADFTLIHKFIAGKR